MALLRPLRTFTTRAPGRCCRACAVYAHAHVCVDGAVAVLRLGVGYRVAPGREDGYADHHLFAQTAFVSRIC